MARKTAPAMYCKTVRGKSIAHVCLTDYTTGRRKDHWLGAWGSADAIQKYARVVAEWAAAGMRVVDDRGGLTVQSLCDQYDATGLGGITGPEQQSRRAAMRALTALYGGELVEEFGPRHLRTVQSEFVRMGWTRRYVNAQVYRLVAVFRWGVVHCGVGGKSIKLKCVIGGGRRMHTTAAWVREFLETQAESRHV